MRRFFAILLFLGPAWAHQPYENYSQWVPQVPPAGPYTGKTKPNGGSCCGGTDCDVLKIEPGVLKATDEGYKITLTLEQARKINPYRTRGTTFIVPWEQIQPSWNADYHLCIPNDEEPRQPYAELPKFYCFWEPPGA